MKNIRENIQLLTMFSWENQTLIVARIIIIIAVILKKVQHFEEISYHYFCQYILNN